MFNDPFWLDGEAHKDPKTQSMGRITVSLRALFVYFIYFRR
jgi:hypothetical protein